MGRAVFLPGRHVGHWVALVGVRVWERGGVLTMRLVGLVGMGGMLPPGDVVVHGWPHGSLWPSGALGLVEWGRLVLLMGVQVSLGVGTIGWRVSFWWQVLSECRALFGHRGRPWVWLSAVGLP